jgi:hypothetical protein
MLTSHLGWDEAYDILFQDHQRREGFDAQYLGGDLRKVLCINTNKRHRKQRLGSLLDLGTKGNTKGTICTSTKTRELLKVPEERC